MLTYITIGNYFVDTLFMEFHVDISPYVKTSQQSEIINCTQIVDPNCNIVEHRNTNIDTKTNF